MVERTKVAFENRQGEFRLDWPEEKALVNEVLDDFYSHFIRAEAVSSKEAKIKHAKKGEVTELPKPEHKTKAISVNDALGIFDQAFLQRDPRDLERTLRNINNVQVGCGS